MENMFYIIKKKKKIFIITMGLTLTQETNDKYYLWAQFAY